MARELIEITPKLVFGTCMCCVVQKVQVHEIRIGMFGTRLCRNCMDQLRQKIHEKLK